MPLASLSSFDGVRSIYFHMLPSGALSIAAVLPAPTCPWDRAAASVPCPTPSAQLARAAARRCLCGSCTGICVGFLCAKLTLVAELVHLFWLPGLPFALLGLCACFSSWVALCDAGLVWTCSAPLPALCVTVLCTCFVSPPTLFVTGFCVLLSAALGRGCALPRLHASPLLAPWAHSA